MRRMRMPANERQFKSARVTDQVGDNPLQGRTIDAILLDLDGTLVETHNRWPEMVAQRLAPLEHLFRRLRIPIRLDTEALARKLVMGIEMPANYAISIVEHLGLDSNLMGLGDRIRRSKGLATRNESLLLLGSQRLLETLQGHYALAVVTTRARPEAHAFLAESRLDRFFEVVVTRQDVFRMKPHPAPILRAAEGLGVAPDRCLMVGDTSMDMRAARRAGAVAVGVLSGMCTREELERGGAHLILDRAVELLPYLDSRDGRQ